MGEEDPKDEIISMALLQAFMMAWASEACTLLASAACSPMLCMLCMISAICARNASLAWA